MAKLLLSTSDVHQQTSTNVQQLQKLMRATAPLIVMGGSKMRFAFCLPVAAAALLSIAVPAQAMPLATSPAGSDAGITLVRDGCGPFGHRSNYGYCKPNGDGYGRGGYGRDGYGGGPRFGGGYGRGPGFGGGYGERRCFIRETYNGPVRVCR